MKVLVPADCVPFFAAEASLGLQPIPYRIRSGRVWARAAKRAGFGALIGRAAVPIDLEHDSAAHECEAAWISSAVPAKVHVLEQLLALMPKARKIYWQRTDLDGMPLDLARRRGVEVVTTGDLTSGWVAEANLACIATDCKRIGRTPRRGPDGSLPFVKEFGSVRVGIVGSGRIGRATASMCRAIGMRTAVLTRDPSRLASAEHPFDQVVGRPETLEDAVSTFDYLVLALPCNSSTAGMISEPVLRSMAETVLVNLARPRLVDQPAMLRALRSGDLQAAWVSRLEDLSALDRWRAARTPNLFLTHNLEAHVATKQRAAFQQFVRFLAEGSAG